MCLSICFSVSFQLPWLVVNIACGLWYLGIWLLYTDVRMRHCTNVELRPAGGKGADFLVVDINYFPGYEKLPNHAELMVDFLLSLLHATKGQGRQIQRHLSSCLDHPGSDSE